MHEQKRKEPWKVAGVPWKSEAAFWSWVRGVLRKGWSKHPVKLEYIKQHRKRIPNPKPSKRFPEVWGMTCEICKKDTVQTEIEIDHIAETGGKFTCLDDIKSYAEHLFMVDFSCLRALCKPCHRIVSHSQNTGMSFEEAKLEKQVIEFCKKDKQIILAFLQEHGHNGVSVSSAVKRRKLVEQIFKEGVNE
jgi:hypothetical protein